MLRKNKPRAGRAAMAEFRRRRRATMRREWRDWAMLGVLIVVFTVGVVFFDGWLKVAWAVVLGMLLTTLIVLWVIGGDVTSLTWVRGATGERQTEEALLELPDGWEVFHDVPDGRGNWDHVAIGPGGIFAIDTKTYSTSAKVENDVLRSGGIRTPGIAFRGSAVRLKKTLEREAGVSTWVQAVELDAAGALRHAKAAELPDDLIDRIRETEQSSRRTTRKARGSSGGARPQTKTRKAATPRKTARSSR